MAEYSIQPDAGSLHGAFSRDLAPVLTIDPGDTVRFRTLDSGWGLEARRSTKREEPPLQAPRPAGHDGHALCGPVAIRGALPGATLAVRIEALRPGAWGYTATGGWTSFLNTRLGLAEQGTYLLWTLDADALLGRDQHGNTVALRPFMGVMGMPPAGPGLHSTVPPRATGGNLDCKELVPGSTLYLPIAVPGGLFSVGDGHARQGDGESSGTAIECPMERVDLTFDLEPTMHLDTPRALTPAGWITFGMHESLEEAVAIALGAMVDLIAERFGMTRADALGWASVVVDVRITQLVNQVQGAHAVLPHGAITAAVR